MPDDRQRILLITGGFLILIGLAFLAAQLFSKGGLLSWVPMAAGVILFIVTLFVRIPGISALACLLIGGGAGLLWYQAADPQSSLGGSGAVFFLCLSSGFLLIPVATRVLDGKALKWPLIPGIIGVLAGIALLLP